MDQPDKKNPPKDPAATTSHKVQAGDTSMSRHSGSTVGGETAEDLASLKRIGRFEVIELLGQGAFGAVFKARDPKLERDVAVKIPLKGLQSALGTKGDVERFLKEAKAAAGIQHPNICPVFEVGRDGGREFIVMSYVPGLSLAELLKSRGERLPIKQSVQIVRKLALALDAAHQRGIVHRDLKPANVMFDRERKDVVIMDFGLARMPQSDSALATQSGVVVGTPAYMAPEQARGDAKAAGSACDVYSLGVILYELLTGERPFTGSVMEVIGKVLHVEPKPLHTIAADVPIELESLCLQAMAKDPEKRIPSMKAFAGTLGLWLKGESLSSQPTSTVSVPKRNAEADASTKTTDLVAELLQQHQEERKKTVRAVRRAVKKSKTSPWKMFAAVGVPVLLVAVAIFAHIRVTSAASVMVVLNLPGVDLTDVNLTYILDGKPISPTELEKPVNLDVGEHELVIKRGSTELQRLKFGVKAGWRPGIEIKESKSRPDFVGNPELLLAEPWENVFTKEYMLSIPANERVDDDKRHVRGQLFRRPQSGRDVAAKMTVHPHPGKTTGINLRYSNRGFYTGYHEGDAFTIVKDTHLWGSVPARWVTKELVRVNSDVKPPFEMAFAAVDDHLFLFVDGKLVVQTKDDALADGILGAQGLHGVTVISGLHFKCLDEPESNPDEERRVARDLLRRGERITVQSGGVEREVDLVRELPDKLIQVVKAQIRLNRNNALPFLISDTDLRRLAGMKSLRELELAGTGVEAKGQGISFIAEIPTLEKLWLHYSMVGNDAGPHLAKMTQLKSLRLDGAKFDEQGMHHLAGLTKLNFLDLGFLAISDGVKHLEGMTELETLALYGTQINDAHFRHFKNMKKLKEFSGSRLPLVKGTGFDVFAGSQNLTFLDLPMSGIDDEGCKSIAKLPALKTLNLSGTGVTDVGFKRFAALKSLQWVDVESTSVSIRARRELQEALPECRIKPSPSGTVDPNYERYAQGEWKPIWRDAASSQNDVVKGAIGKEIKFKNGAVEIANGALTTRGLGKNHALRVQVKFVTSHGCSLVVGSGVGQETNNYGCWWNGYGQFGLGRHKDMKFVGFESTTKHGLPVNQFFEWMLVRDGNTLSTFVNGQLLLHYVDDMVTGDAVGIWVNDKKATTIKDAEYRVLDSGK